MDRSAQNRIDRALVDGVGGLEFLAQSPPGLGRLVRVPFYMEDAFAGFAAMSGQALPIAAAAGSLTHPVIVIINGVFPALGLPGLTALATMRTPVVSWAILRVVGFETFVQRCELIVAMPMGVSFGNLSLGGGPDLFPHPTLVPDRVYDGRSDSLSGLRDYPILRAPNRVEVNVQAMGQQASPVTTFSCNLVCEILEDDEHGLHIPGPYARPGALVREQPSAR